MTLWYSPDIQGEAHIKEGGKLLDYIWISIQGYAIDGAMLITAPYPSCLYCFIYLLKVAAVSPKRHTTTKNILGITTLGNSQIYFHDTPGFTSHHDKADCRSELSRAARDAINLVHLTLVVVDASKPTTDRVLVNLHGLLEQCVRSPGRLALVLNKIDLVNPKQHLLKKTDDLMKKIQHIMEQMNVEIDKEDAGILDHNPPVTQATGSDVPDRNKEKRHSSRSPATNKFKRHRNVSSVHDRMEVFMISAKSGDGVGDILKLLERQARPGRWHFDSGKTSNMSELLRATEIIRESLYVHLHQEIPYTITQCTRYAGYSTIMPNCEKHYPCHGVNFDRSIANCSNNV